MGALISTDGLKVEEFAHRHDFPTAESINAPDATDAPIGLEAVLTRLPSKGRAAGLQSFACGLTVWIANEKNGERIEGSLASIEPGWHRTGSVARWLASNARLELPAGSHIGPGRNLEALIKRLHDYEINAGFELDRELRVWIGDPFNGIRRSATVTATHATAYLHQAARSIYPESNYGKQRP